MKVIFSCIACLLLGSCANRVAYDGIQANNRIECNKLPPTQYKDCIDRANRSTDEYELEREEVLEPDGILEPDEALEQDEVLEQ